MSWKRCSDRHGRQTDVCTLAPEEVQRRQLGKTCQSHDLGSDSLKLLFDAFSENNQQQQLIDLDEFLVGLKMTDDPFLPDEFTSAIA
jgi:hypothetical protein